MKLRLKYKKEISLENVALKKIKHTIVDELEQLNANNIIVENNDISFKNNEMELRRNYSLMANLKEGKFEIIEEKNHLVLHFVGQYSIFSSLILFLPLGIYLSITQGPQFLLFCLMSGLSILIKKSIVTNGCDELIEKLSNSQNDEKN
jgi:hypothetical protein